MRRLAVNFNEQFESSIPSGEILLLLEPLFLCLTEITSSLRVDITTLFQSEFKTILAEEFDMVKIELQAVKTEFIRATTLLRSELLPMKASLSAMEQGLTECFDDISLLYTTI